MPAERLVDVVRGGYVESGHTGHIAVVDSKGRLLYSCGDPKRHTFARSSMKPLQAIPIIETGAAEHYKMQAADISLACASHNGEDQHTIRVKDILHRLELEVDDLKCGTHPPRWTAAYENVIKTDTPITPVYNNCSGKHSGMLTTAKHMNESTDDYYQIDHPVQQRILEVISDLSEVPIDEIEIGIDGCGVPVHGIPLDRLALSFAKMSKPGSFPEKRKQAIETVTSSMMAEPEMVGGTDRFCTDFMKVMAGRMFGKAGAEGVYCIGDLETGLGIAVKIEDGNGRAVYPAAVEVLKQLELLTGDQLEQLSSYHEPALKNARDEIIGHLKPVFSMKSASCILS
ncbi:asparaginase [Sporosarcina gallistercoris]|uniref:Asparaginase n=1 Tax=Sporosarcina gallistercoris TaxID=2762245 RepID=A0ABR8PLI8_9BACL|nr:asparaginase [Sporosarcina gallistercoris]MBD7909048.1 asparaginase [Sporosarcina gallistercoris]